MPSFKVTTIPFDRSILNSLSGPTPGSNCYGDLLFLGCLFSLSMCRHTSMFYFIVNSTYSAVLEWIFVFLNGWVVNYIPDKTHEPQLSLKCHQYTWLVTDETVHLSHIGVMYKAVDQLVLLYSSDTWVLTGEILKFLEVFGHRAARRITGMTETHGAVGEWEYPPVLAAM